MTPFRSTFQLTAAEEAVLRGVNKNPEDFIAIPVAVEIDPTRPVEIIRVPASAAGPARQLVRVPLHLGLDAAWFHYSKLVGPNGQNARSPVDGMIGFMPARLVLPQKNFTEAGQEAIRAHVEGEKAEWTTARNGSALDDWEPKVEDEPSSVQRTITILDREGNPVDPRTLPDNAVLRWDFGPVAVELAPTLAVELMGRPPGAPETDG